MKFHIIGDHSTNESGDMSLVNSLNHDIKNGKQLFIFIFMDGCGPCNSTKPSWDNIRPKLERKYKDDDSTVIVRLNKDLFDKMSNIGEDPAGFPTLRRISSNGNVIEEYENSGLNKLDRSTTSFINWIEKHVKPKMHGVINRHKRNTNKRQSRRLRHKMSTHMYGGKRRHHRRTIRK